MNSHARLFIKNMSFSTVANLLSSVISILLVLIVPKVLGITQYGLWQLFIFFAGYIGYLHFGWADGVYLRYGGKDYDELEKPLFHSQFWLLTIFEFIIAVLILLSGLFFVQEADERYITFALAICCVVQLPGTFLRLILQATNRIQEYSKNLLVEKISYGILVVVLLLAGVRSYLPLILANIVALILSSLHMIYHCRDIVKTSERVSFRCSIQETKESVKCGISLLLANLSSMFILGISRIAIQLVWGIETFAKLSLSLNICSFIMVFINAIGIVIFPVIKKVDEVKWKAIFKNVGEVLTFIMIAILVFFFIGKKLLAMWLPQYTESAVMLGLMFPMCLYEAKMSLLYNTFFKAMRKECFLLIVNICTCLLSAALVGIFAIGLKSLTLTCLSIVFSLAFRCCFSEIVLSKIVDVRAGGRIILETFVSILFILCATLISNEWIGMLLYIAVIVVFYFSRHKYIHESVRYFTQILKK